MHQIADQPLESDDRLVDRAFRSATDPADVDLHQVNVQPQTNHPAVTPSTTPRPTKHTATAAEVFTVHELKRERDGIWCYSGVDSQDRPVRIWSCAGVSQPGINAWQDYQDVWRPASPSVIGWGAKDGSVFVVEKAHPATTLESVASGSPLPIDLAFGIMLQICEALKPLHAQNLVHGDVNVDTVFWDAETSHCVLGGAAIRSFAADHGQMMTRTPKLDVRGLGQVLYFLLHGEPYYGQTIRSQDTELTFFLRDSLQSAAGNQPIDIDEVPTLHQAIALFEHPQGKIKDRTLTPQNHASGAAGALQFTQTPKPESRREDLQQPSFVATASAAQPLPQRPTATSPPKTHTKGVRTLLPAGRAEHGEPKTATKAKSMSPVMTLGIAVCLLALVGVVWAVS